MRRIQLGERQRLWWPELAGNELAAVPEFGRRSIRRLRHLPEPTELLHQHPFIFSIIR